MAYVLEVCVDSVESAVEAAAGGATRLELCGDLLVGGTTPSIKLFEWVKRKVTIPVNVLIRPRPGDFCYTAYEFGVMREEVKMYREAGADGVVSGVLAPEGAVDTERTKELVALAGDMSFTFHRAFDVCKSPVEAFSVLSQMGVNTILTSGQKDRVAEGLALVKDLAENASGSKTVIMAGGGLTRKTVEALLSETKVRAFHLSGKVSYPSRMVYRKEGVSMGFPAIDEFILWRTEREKIALMKVVIEKCLNY